MDRLVLGAQALVGVDQGINRVKWTFESRLGLITTSTPNPTLSQSSNAPSENRV
ncbi:hypothetical protein COCC4DRAFT_33045, partial [Bipolaris maydis ATCC 48331]